MVDVCMREESDRCRTLWFENERQTQFDNNTSTDTLLFDINEHPWQQFLLNLSEHPSIVLPCPWPHRNFQHKVNFILGHGPKKTEAMTVPNTVVFGLSLDASTRLTSSRRVWNGEWCCRTDSYIDTGNIIVKDACTPTATVRVHSLLFLDVVALNTSQTAPGTQEYIWFTC